MTKRELKKQQKQEKLIAKISQMPEKEYVGMQIKLDNVAHRLFSLNLIFFSLVAVFGFGSIFTIGTSLLPIFVGVSLGSMVGILITTALTHGITNKIKANSNAKYALVSMEEIEEQQKQQTQEIINRIKKERVAKTEVGVNQPEEELENENLSI